MTEGQAVLDAASAGPVRGLSQTRTLIAIGDPARERLVLQLLSEAVEGGPPLRLVRRCLDANDLLGSIQTGEIDAAIVGADLHGFGVDALRALGRARIPVVLWGVTDGGAAIEALDGARVTVLSREVDVGELRSAIGVLATSGGRLRRPSLSAVVPAAELERAVMPARSALAPYRLAATRSGSVIALVSPPGGHGVSILAAGLTAALSREGSAALVDLNLERPSQALALDLNPARNLYMVLHEAGARDDPTVWARLLVSELQPLDATLSRAVVLSGAPGGLAANVGSEGVRQLLRQLTICEEFVVADVGSTLDGGTPVAAAHRAALEAADRVLIVTRSDLVGLRRAAQLVDCLHGILDDPEHRLGLLLNQHDSRQHHDAIEVARALRLPVAAVVPNDFKSVHAALAAQRPLVACGSARRGSAAHALIELARQLHRAETMRAPHAASDSTRTRFKWPRRLWPLAWQGGVHE